MNVQDNATNRISVFHQRDLLWVLVQKELKVRYKRVSFGILWAVFNPLLQMLVLAVVFVSILHIPIPGYPLFLLTGLLPWTFLSLGIAAGTTSVVDNGPVVRKVAFSRILLPIAAVLGSLVHFLISIGLLVLGLLFFRPGLPLTALLLPIVMACQFFFVLAVTLLTSGLYVRFRDTRFIVDAILMVGFYATPVLYPLRLVPENWRWLLILNPMTSFVETYRGILWDGVIPQQTILILPLLFTCALLATGIFLFRKQEFTIADYV
jgi:ABC-type polysaccharide/polyol phosphate export permease